MPDTWYANTRCSFCHKRAPEVTQLIAGPGVHICDQCVDLCVLILKDQPGTDAETPRVPMWESMTEDEILDHLPKIVAVQHQVDDNLREWIAHLRTRNVSWERIGASINMSRQSAWERFR
ncbi:ClpX C4-type zinc finger protein [Nocardia sp. NPDC003482]